MGHFGMATILPMQTAIAEVESRRLLATKGLATAHRADFGQFFTPAPIAQFMAAWLQPGDQSDPLILDAGAGIGSLSAAALTRLGKGSVTAYELEPLFQTSLQKTLDGFSGKHRIIPRDFVADAVSLLAAGSSPAYDMAILNPPYRKIATNSVHRTLLRKLGVETSNLYACFIACAVALCKPGAQVVAIVPRSFMNGPYFKPFRYWLLDRVALTHIHVFKRRDRAFADDGVLQENVILRMVVRGVQETVAVSTSQDQSFSDLQSRSLPFETIVTTGDEERFIHVPNLDDSEVVNLPGLPLRQLGLDVCTGPVVDFRLREHLCDTPTTETAPLLYASHFVGGALQWPRETRKPNAIHINATTQPWLLRNGCYVLLRRFTSKEEKRRVVAYLLPEGALTGPWLGVENHLNVIHQDRHGLEPVLARGLCRYLNSQAVDDYFRTFSGHTQVNATDLRRLHYPSRDALCALGKMDEEKG